MPPLWISVNRKMNEEFAEGRHDRSKKAELAGTR